MMKPTHTSRSGHTPAGSSLAGGFSLIELMVAITLGLFLVIGLISLIVSNSVARTEFDKSSRQIENGRYALSLLTEDIEHAGFTGATASRTSASVTQAAPTLCAATMTGAALGYSASINYVATVPFSVYTPDDPDDAVTACGLGTTHQPDTAIVAVSRASTSTMTIAAAASAPGVAYLQSSTCSDETIPFAVNPAASGTGTTRFPLRQTGCTTSSPLRPLIQRVYFVSKCNVCAGASADTQPTLKVAEYDATGEPTITPLVEGIQDLQLYYGIDADNNGSPDSYSVAPAATDWPNVVTVRIHVLARNEDPSAGWTDNRTYDMGVAGVPVGPFNDKYKRHVYSGVARLYNISGQRELQ